MKNYSVFFLKRKILEKPALLELIPKSLKIFRYTWYTESAVNLKGVPERCQHLT